LEPRYAQFLRVFREGEEQEAVYTALLLVRRAKTRGGTVMGMTIIQAAGSNNPDLNVIAKRNSL
jgi:hypothetical protein